MSDLALISCDRCSIDNNAPATIFIQNVVGRHFLCAQAQHVKRAHQIDLDNAIEFVQRERTFLAHGPHCIARAGKVTANVNCAKLFNRRGNTGSDRFLAGHVYVAENHHTGIFRYQLITLLLIHIEDRGLASISDKTS